MKSPKGSNWVSLPLMGEENSSPVCILRHINHQNHEQGSSDLELDEIDVFYKDSSYNSPNHSPGNHKYHYRFTEQRFGISSLFANPEDPPHVTSPQEVPCYKSSMERSELHQSAPIAVPAWRGGMEFDNWEEEEDRGFDEEGEMVPPHLMVARSQATNGFSVLEGMGRTLKGRDLRRVRNAVWQKTGFLDL